MGIGDIGMTLNGPKIFSDSDRKVVVLLLTWLSVYKLSSSKMVFVFFFGIQAKQ